MGENSDWIAFILFYFICVALFRGETGTPMPSLRLLRFLKNYLQLRSTAMRHDVGGNVTHNCSRTKQEVVRERLLKMFTFSLTFVRQ